VTTAVSSGGRPGGRPAAARGWQHGARTEANIVGASGSAAGAWHCCQQQQQQQQQLGMRFSVNFKTD